MDPNKEKNVGCAATSQKKKESLKCLPNEASIYSAETTAIDLAMNIIVNHKASKFIIYTDSKSVLLALQNRDTSSPLITKLLNKLHTLSKNNNIIFTWIPSHIGIQGNEKAKLQKKFFKMICVGDLKKRWYTDLKPTIKKFISDKWEKSWDNQAQNKFHEAIEEWPTGHRSIRREVILVRLHIGYTHITHSHLLKGEDAPVCPTCKVQLTTKHILLNCNNLKHIRTKYYQARNLRDIFKNTNPENIFNFLKKKATFSARYNQTSI